MSDFGIMHSSRQAKVTGRKPCGFTKASGNLFCEAEENALCTRHFRKIKEERQWKEVTPDRALVCMSDQSRVGSDSVETV